MVTTALGAIDGVCVVAEPELETATGAELAGSAAGSRAEAGTGPTMLKMTAKSNVVRKTRDMFSSLSRTCAEQNSQVVTFASPSGLVVSISAQRCGETA
jgi:hypothetical protein